MDHNNYCRLCLGTNVKMYCLDSSFWMLETYSQLFQLPFQAHGQYVCYICATMLRKFKEFRAQCYTAHELLTLMEPASSHSQVTKQNISRMDKYKYNLETKLMFSPIILITTGEINQSYNTCDDIETVSDTGTKELEQEVIYYVEQDANREDVNEISSNASNHTFSDADENELKSNTSVIKKYLTNTDGETTRPVSVFQEKATISSAENKVNTSIGKSKISVEEIRNLSFNDAYENESKIGTSTSVLNEYLINTDEESTGTEFVFPEKVTMSSAGNKEIHHAKNTMKTKIERAVEELHNYFKIVKLTIEDNEKALLQRKEENIKRNVPFLCNYCFTGYTSKVTFDNHMTCHNPESGSWKCNICHQRFPHERNLRQHFQIVHERKFSCKFCSYTCSNSSKAYVHVDLHKGKQYTCQICDITYSKLCSFYMHMSKKHIAVCLCDLCGSAFSSQKGVEVHKNKRHKTDKNDGNGPLCDECEVQFASELAYKRHLVLSPKHKVSNGCKICGETFSNKRELMSHRKGHIDYLSKHGNKKPSENPETSTFEPHACSICNVWLNTRREHYSHRLRRHPTDKAIVCEICGQPVSDMFRLALHQLKHTGAKPHSCKDCGKKVTTKLSLNKHMETHQKDRSVIKCPQCSKCFLSKPALDKHRKTFHLALRPHKCTMCGKAYLNLCEVKLHMKHVHFKVPWPKRNRSKRTYKQRQLENYVDEDNDSLN